MHFQGFKDAYKYQQFLFVCFPKAKLYFGINTHFKFYLNISLTKKDILFIIQLLI